MERPLRPGRLAAWATVLVCAAFAFKALVLIDRTSLWNDELRSVIKSFQPAPAELFRQLRQDTHPPLYYLLLWLWGQLVGQSALTLRLFSWCAYGIGGVLMAAQAAGLAVRRRRAAALAALMAFCSPFPVRFAIEGKGYALLALWVAAALLLRRRLLQQPQLGGRWRLGYGIAVALAALTHYYGLFLLGSAVLWDGWRRRWRLALTAALGLVPTLLWILWSAEYLSSDAAAPWIGPPEFALLEDSLARALGPWPLPKLALLLLGGWALQRWAGDPRLRPPGRLAWPVLLDRSGVLPAALMVVLVVAVSYLKPLAFYRYFFVLVPAVVPAVAAAAADWGLSRRGERAGLLALALMLLLSWRQAFLAIDPPAGVWWRESNDFRTLSLRLEGAPHRYAARPELLEASDRMQRAAGRLSGPPAPWGDEADLRAALATGPLPPRLLLAAAGRRPTAERRLEDLEALARGAGYACAPEAAVPPGARIVACRLRK